MDDAMLTVFGKRCAVKAGDHVRIVRMDGCMAHVRGDVKTGTVEGVSGKQKYGDSILRPYASIRLEDGSIDERCAERGCWWPNESDGVMEYRY